MLTPLEWVSDQPRQPEDRSYRVLTYRQRSDCRRFSVEKSRNEFSGLTSYVAWHHCTDPDAPNLWLGTSDSAAAARQACEDFRAKMSRARELITRTAEYLESGL